MSKRWVTIKSKRGKWPLKGKVKYRHGVAFEVDEKSKDVQSALKCHILSPVKGPVVTYGSASTSESKVPKEPDQPEETKE